MFFDASDHHGIVRVTDLCDDTDSVSSLDAQRAGEEIRPIVKFAGGSEDPILGVLRNRGCGRGIVQNGGNSAGGQADALGDGLQRDSIPRGLAFGFAELHSNPPNRGQGGMFG